MPPHQSSARTGRTGSILSRNRGSRSSRCPPPPHPPVGPPGRPSPLSEIHRGNSRDRLRAPVMYRPCEQPRIAMCQRVPACQDRWRRVIASSAISRAVDSCRLHFSAVADPCEGVQRGVVCVGQGNGGVGYWNSPNAFANQLCLSHLGKRGRQFEAAHSHPTGRPDRALSPPGWRATTPQDARQDRLADPWPVPRALCAACLGPP